MILRRHFLHQSTPTVYLLNKIKQIWFLFSEDTVFIFINSAVCWTPGSHAPRCASHRGVNLHTTELKIGIFESLWLLLKGQSGEFLISCL